MHSTSYLWLLYVSEVDVVKLIYEYTVEMPSLEARNVTRNGAQDIFLDCSIFGTTNRLWCLLFRDCFFRKW